MLFSLYPTDPPDVRSAVIAQARRLTSEPTLFTSLHIPEADALEEFLDELASLHRDTGARFWADISPATLERLGWSIDDLTGLAAKGVTGLRIDYGFDTSHVTRIAATGVSIAINASTVTAEELDRYAEFDVTGWHNYYPRPETGLSAEHFVAQTSMFGERGLPVLAFIPGEVTQRAPLHRGLPTLEAQRHVNTWVNLVRLHRLAPDVEVVCAEGTVREEHLEWIERFQDTGELTLPLSELTPGAHYLLDQPWRLRAEQSGLSQRLEGTRGRVLDDRLPHGTQRRMGALQMDGPAWKRYAGEVHLMSATQPVDPDQFCIGQVASPYVDVVPELRGRDSVRFIQWPRT